MKRTVSEGRKPEPLQIYSDPTKVKNDMVEVAEKLSDEGYGADFIYQVGAVTPPVEEYSSIIDELKENSVYVTVSGLKNAQNFYNTKSEQIYPEYEVRNTGEFERIVEDIDEVVEEANFKIDYWNISGVQTSAQSGSDVADNLEGLELQITAEVDAGLESQRGEMGFQPIRIGWFYRAPMNREMEFGLRAFPNREFEHDDKKDYEESEREPFEDILGRLTGQRDDEINQHHLSDEEAEALRQLEKNMREHGLM